ncbi:hypothetical protein C3L33_07517, partial [Rhododendron williamsianum]
MGQSKCIEYAKFIGSNAGFLVDDSAKFVVLIQVVEEGFSQSLPLHSRTSYSDKRFWEISKFGSFKDILKKRKVPGLSVKSYGLKLQNIWKFQRHSEEEEGPRTFGEEPFSGKLLHQRINGSIHSVTPDGIDIKLLNDVKRRETCILKVNVGSCEECAAKLKKYLAKVDGVHGVDVDAEKELVRVSGKVDPRKLIRKLAEKKMKAELLSYGDPIMIRKTRIARKCKRKRRFIPLVPQYDHGGCRLGTDLPYRVPPSNPLQFSPPNNTHWFPPAPPNLHYPQYYGGPIVPQYDSSGYCRGADHDASCMWPSLQPLPPCDHYGARHIPANNDFTQFFSDENAVGCTVM